MARKKNNQGTSDKAPADATAIGSVSTEAASTAEEKAQVRRWLDTLTEECALWKDDWKGMRKWQRRAAGESEYDVKVNLHQATLETLLPLLYAQDPEIEAKPQESVDGARYGALKPFCQTLEIVIDRELHDASLKENAKRTIRASKVTGFGVIKVNFQTDTEDDPLIINRINDVQDNLQHASSLAQRIASGAQSGDTDAMRADLSDTIESIKAKIEVIKSIGVVLDVVPSTCLVVPHVVGELIDYRMSPWLAQYDYMPKVDAVAKYQLSEDEAQKVTTFQDRDDCDETVQTAKPVPLKKEGTSKSEKRELVRVWEVWDRRTGMVYTLIEGMDERYAKPPFPPKLVGRRFYPYFILAFSWVDGRRLPLSAVDMADDLVQEYNAVRSGYREHRRRAVPARVGSKSAFTKEDAEKLTDPEINELVLIENQDGQKVQDSVGVLQYPRVDPGLYDTTVIRGELDIIYGVQDAMRGEVMRAKTAREAGILQQGLSTRTDGQRDTLESWLAEIGGFVAEVLLLAMPEEQVIQIAGEGAQWPKLSRSQIQNDVLVQIRAGTTGKPDAQAKTSEWVKLLPEVMPLIEKYVQAKMAGQDGIAESIKAVVVETFRRFDDRVDADQFLPQQIQPMPPKGPPLQEQVLAGPQVLGLVQILADMKAGVIASEVGKAALEAAFPAFPPPLIEQMAGMAAPSAPAPGATGTGIPAPNGSPSPMPSVPPAVAHALLTKLSQHPPAEPPPGVIPHAAR